MSKIRIAIAALSLVAFGGFMVACDDSKHSNNNTTEEGAPQGSGSPDKTKQTQAEAEMSEELQIQILLNEMSGDAELAASGCETEGQMETRQKNIYDSNLSGVMDKESSQMNFEAHLSGLSYSLKTSGEKDRYCQLGYVTEVAEKTLFTYIAPDDEQRAQEQIDFHRARRKSIALAIHPIYVEARNWVNVFEEGKQENVIRAEISDLEEKISRNITDIKIRKNAINSYLECESVEITVGVTETQCKNEQHQKALAQVFAAERFLAISETDLEKLNNGFLEISIGKLSIKLSAIKKIAAEAAAHASTLRTRLTIVSKNIGENQALPVDSSGNGGAQ